MTNAPITSAPSDAAGSASAATRMAALARYWLNALTDGNLSAAGDAASRVVLELDDMAAGTFPPGKGAELADQPSAKGRAGGTAPAGRPVLACLAAAGDEKRVYVLAGMNALLDEQGQLMPAGTPPRLNRAFLEPNDSPPFVIGAAADGAEFLAKNPLPETQSWRDWWDHLARLFCAVVGESRLEDFVHPFDSPLSQHRSYRLIGLIAPASGSSDASARIEQIYRQVLSSGTPLPDDDRTREAADPARLALFRRITEGGFGRKTFEGADAAGADRLLSGHIDETTASAVRGREIFPFDPSQRCAVRHAGLLEEGDVLAVNGPPGTGKTNMLKGVIASRWVNAALEGGACPVVVACGATNQSVTNVIRSFGAVAHPDNTWPLARRWIDGLPSYGAFLPSAKYLKDHPEDAKRYQILRKAYGSERGLLVLEGVATNVFDPTRREGMMAAYLRAAGAAFGAAFPDVESVVNRMRALLRWAAAEMPEYLVRKLQALEAFDPRACRGAAATRRRVLAELAGIAGQEHEAHAHAVRQRQDVRTKAEDAARLRESWLRTESGVRKECFADTLRQFAERGHSTAGAARAGLDAVLLADDLLRDYERQLTEVDATERRLLSELASRKAALQAEADRLEQRLKQRGAAADLVRAVAQIAAAPPHPWCDMRKGGLFRQCARDLFVALLLPESRRAKGLAAQYGEERPAVLAELLERFLDCSLRPLAFHVAARYWEGRFLLDGYERLHTRTVRNVRAIAERLCMITPCVVTTLNSVPRLAELDANYAPAGMTHLFGLFDLLIVDEAGQALPEVGAAAFALARRGLVVGDLQQLAPVWSFEGADEPSLASAADLGAAVDDLHWAGQSCASGSIMAIGRWASAFNRGADKGITLLNHYRCRPSIIELCNRLTYGRTLMAVTQEPAPGKALLPTMSWVEVRTSARKSGGSWVNDKEADEIATWIVARWQDMAAHYPGKKIREIVAVLTPFRPQAKLIKSRLEQAFDVARSDGRTAPPKEDVDKVIIGTVHSLQGAECPIVAFSAVSTPDGSKAPFIDRNRNLLNVAVSRAKDAFILFGHPDSHFPEGAEPVDPADGPATRVLGDYMREAGQRLYPKVLFLVEAGGKVESIRRKLGPDYHVEATIGATRKLTLRDDAVDVAGGLRPQWSWVEDKDGGSRRDRIAKLAKDAQSYAEIVLATDADMAGEGIAWHLKRDLLTLNPALSAKRITRARIGAITKPALEAALAQAGDIDRNLAQADVCRAIIDALLPRVLGERLNAPAEKPEQEMVETFLERHRARFGNAPATPSATAGRPFTAGRVSGAVLSLLLEREQGRLRAPEGLWHMRALVAAEDGEPMAAELLGKDGMPVRFASEADARAAAERLVGISGLLPAGRSTEEIQFSAPPPNTTAELLRRAWRRTPRIPPDRAMAALQALYEGKLGSPQTPPGGFRSRPFGGLPFPGAAQRTQAAPAAPPAAAPVAAYGFAHPPIAPLSPEVSPALARSRLSPDQLALYELVYSGAQAAAMPPAQVIRSELRLAVPDTEWVLCLRGCGVRSPGWIEALPDIFSGLVSEWPGTVEDLDRLALRADQLEVKAAAVPLALDPGPLGVDDLLDLMEIAAIGRPSTYATVIAELADKGYAELSEQTGTVRLTERGMTAALRLQRRAGDLATPRFCAEFERDLDRVADGTLSPDVFLRMRAEVLFGREVADRIAAFLWTDLDSVDAPSPTGTPRPPEAGEPLIGPVAGRELVPAMSEHLA